MAPQRFSTYMALMSELIEAEPSSFQEAFEQWIYKIKHIADGSVEKFKARFVDKGFS
jgi:hypothetical protein